MEEKCVGCGLPVSDNPDWYRTCDGEMYEDCDPYAADVYGEYVEVYACGTQFARMAEDI